MTETRNYNFGEKKIENGLESIFDEKYLEARKKVVELIESEMYGLTAGDFYAYKMYTKNGQAIYTSIIIKHDGCLKINECLDESNKFQVAYMSRPQINDKGDVLYEYIDLDDSFYATGEVVRKEYTGSFPVTIAFNRLFDRVILKKAKLSYHGIYSEIEAEKFAKWAVLKEEMKAAEKKAETEKKAEEKAAQANKSQAAQANASQAPVTESQVVKPQVTQSQVTQPQATQKAQAEANKSDEAAKSGEATKSGEACGQSKTGNAVKQAKPNEPKTITNQHERLITTRQIDKLKGLYTDAEINTMLGRMNLKSINDIPMKTASGMIAYRLNTKA